MNVGYKGGVTRRHRDTRLALGARIGTILVITAMVISGCGRGGSGSAEGQPATCDDPETTQAVVDIIEDGPDKNVNVKVLDLGNHVDRFHDQAAKVRYCAADLVTNVGSGPISYKIYFGPSGQELIEVREGSDAYGAAALAVASPPEETETQTSAVRSASTGNGPAYLVGRPYSQARQWLLSQGLTPRARAQDEPCYQDTCRRYPETESCAGDSAVCSMAFTDRDGRVLRVTIQTENTPSVLGSRWEDADPADQASVAPVENNREHSAQVISDHFDNSRAGENGEDYLRCPSIQAARSAIRSIPPEGSTTEDARYRAFETRAAQLGCTKATGEVQVLEAFETEGFSLGEEDSGGIMVVALRAEDRGQRQVALLFEIAL